ncbi:MAG: SpoIIE family protein phosphatase [Candidatus Geothermincolia bacterium]
MALIQNKVTENLSGIREEVLHRLNREIPTYEALSQEQKNIITAPLDSYLRLMAQLFAHPAGVEQELRKFMKPYKQSSLYEGVNYRSLVAAVYIVADVLWRYMVREAGDDAAAVLEMTQAKDSVTSKVIQMTSEAFLTARDTMVNRQLAQLTGLMAVGQAIASTTDLTRVLDEILGVATTLMETPTGAMLLLEPDGGNLRVASSIGLSKTWLKANPRLPLAETLLERAFEAGEPRRARDEELQTLSLPALAYGARVRSVLSLPVTVGDKLIGGIDLYDSRERLYSPMKLALARTFAPQAGVAIQNARLYEAERSRRRQAVLMKEMAEDISAVVNVGQALQIIAHKLTEVASVKRGMLFLYSPLAEELEFVRGLGISQKELRGLRDLRIGLEDAGPVIGTSVTRGVHMVVKDAAELGGILAETASALRLVSCLVMPLAAKRETVGLVLLDDPGEAHEFKEDDLEAVRAIAGQAAAGIEQVRLRERIKQKELALQRADMRERLFRERERSETILEASPDAIFMVNRDYLINLFNPASADLTGWKETDAYGRSCHELLFGEPFTMGVCNNTLCPIAACFRGERQRYTEFPLRRKDGSSLWVGGSFAPIRNKKRQIESVVGVIRDVSDQKELQNMAKMQQEMQIASDIHNTLFPADTYRSRRCSIKAYLKPARKIGGDWYDYWQAPGKMTVVVGDACGSGLPGAIIGTMAMSLVRAEAHRRTDILEALKLANMAFMKARVENMLITLFMAELDLKTRRLRFVNGGHPDPLLIRGGTHAEFVKCKHRFILGAVDEPDLRVEEMQLEAGDRLVFYTDGLNEAQDERGRLYGFGRLLRYANAQGSQPASSFIEGILERLTDFSGVDLKDDVTIVVWDVH